MPRLDPKHTPLLIALIMSLLMSFLMSGLVTFFNAGLVANFINFAVKPLALAGGYKAAMPKVLDCGEAQFNTFMISLKRREFRMEIC
ncbi:MAG: DUF2798 domain-containing protein [Flavobacteriales bacterium]